MKFLIALVAALAMATVSTADAAECTQDRLTALESQGEAAAQKIQSACGSVLATVSASTTADAAKKTLCDATACLDALDGAAKLAPDCTINGIDFKKQYVPTEDGFDPQELWVRGCDVDQVGAKVERVDNVDGLFGRDDVGSRRGGCAALANHSCRGHRVVDPRLGNVGFNQTDVSNKLQAPCSEVLGLISASNTTTDEQISICRVNSNLCLEAINVALRVAPKCTIKGVNYKQQYQDTMTKVLNWCASSLPLPNADTAKSSATTVMTGASVVTAATFVALAVQH